jgi:cysteinyl-tRNA synthetase
MVRFWLHCHHLQVNGQKMSKSKGNIYYTNTLLEQGYDMREIRFFLIYGHYREKLDYSEENMRSAADKLRKLRNMVRTIEERANQQADLGGSLAQRIKDTFAEQMDNDLDVRRAFDSVYGVLSELELDELKSSEASGVMKTLREIDGVLRVIF